MKNNDNKWSLLERWNLIKYLSHMKATAPIIKAGEIWWCRLGENIGSEMNGKNQHSLRPVYILRKVNSNNAIILPLTSKEKHGSWYYDFKLNNKTEYVNVSQIRMISLFRLENKIGRASQTDILAIKEKVINYLR